MRGSPEAARFDAFVRRAVARARWRLALAGAALGLGIAAAVLLALPSWTWPLAAGVIIVFAVVGAGGSLLVGRVTPTRVIDAVEQHEPASRNLLRTALEIADARTKTTEFVSGQVMRQAAALSERTNVNRALPMGPAATAAGIGAALVVATLGLSARGGIAPVAGPSSPATASLGDVRITVESPAYVGRPAVEFRNPDRIDVLGGSRLIVRVAADATAVSVSTLERSRDAARAPSGEFFLELPADADGYLAIEARSGDASQSDKRLIGLYVQQDRAPAVTVKAPGKDLLVPDANWTLAIALDADDDLGLVSLSLAYTKISGSGENFEFVNGEVPVSVTKSTAQKWTATANWNLAPLKLGQGDMVVYRGLARDGRPGSPAAESDAFFVEIASPGALPSEGFAVDDRFDRYAISQQMVIVKTERLIGARKSITPDEFQERALDLAAEQRQVRAEFVFMMGGHLEGLGDDPDSLNEEEEAAGEDDLAAGRLVNRGRAELMRAIRSMSRAAARLADADATGALPVEKEALAYLQRAFSRSRIILRTLSERERLDLSRRLTGVLAQLARDTRPRREVAPDPVVVAARRALADLGSGARTATERTAIVERILAIRPTSPALRDAAAAVTAGDLPRAAGLLARVIRDAAPVDPPPPPSGALRDLTGSITGALRRNAGRSSSPGGGGGSR